MKASVDALVQRGDLPMSVELTCTQAGRGNKGEVFRWSGVDQGYKSVSRDLFLFACSVRRGIGVWCRPVDTQLDLALGEMRHA
jgi:hypothetical protein